MEGPLTVEHLRRVRDQLAAEVPKPYPLASLRVYEYSALTQREQFRFPRSRRGRIRKKWRKRWRNWRSRPDPRVYKLAGGAIVGHPATIQRLRQRLRTE